MAAANSPFLAGNTLNATDIFERCDYPPGWLEVRSDPTTAFDRLGSEYDEARCDVCSSMLDGFFEATHDGAGEISGWNTKKIG